MSITKKKILLPLVMGFAAFTLSGSAIAHENTCVHYGHTHTYQGQNAEQWNYLGHTFLNGTTHKHTFNHKIYTNGALTHNHTHETYCDYTDPSHW